MGRIIITIILAASMHLISFGQVHDLSQYQWKHRLIILSASDHQDHTVEEQLSAFKNLTDDVANRKLLIIVASKNGTYLRFSNGKFHETQVDASPHNYNTISKNSDEFSMTLIGLDGGVKLKESKIVQPKDVFQLIDGMPMRRAELRR